MTKNVFIFRLSNKMFRNFIGKMTKLIFTAAGFPKVHIVCEPRRGKTWEVALSKIQMMSALLCWVLTHPAVSGTALRTLEVCRYLI